MSNRRLFSYDPTTDTTKYFHGSDDGESFTIETVQNVESLYELNQESRNAQTRLHRWGEGKRVASIPMSVYGELLASGKIHDQAYMRRWLNDPENRKYRTFLGKV